MKRNYPGYSYFLPLMLWSDLATKTLEMMLASAQVIGYRTGRMNRGLGQVQFEIESNVR